MPQRDHSNVWPVDPQSTADQAWQRLVEERLPAELQDQARELKAFVRARGLPSALHLLRGLLYYVLSQASLRDLSVWSRLISLTSKVISSQAWHYRGLPSADWLLWLFNARLSAPNGSFGEQSHRILLVDATHISCRDKRAGTWRLHTAYERLSGRLAWVRISTQHVGEGFAHLRLARRRYRGGRWGLHLCQVEAFGRQGPGLQPGALQCSAFAALRACCSGVDTAVSAGCARLVAHLVAWFLRTAGHGRGASRGVTATETAASPRQRAHALAGRPLVFPALCSWRRPSQRSRGPHSASWSSTEPDGRLKGSSSASNRCSRCTSCQLRPHRARKR